MRKTLAVLLVLLASITYADVAWISGDTCAGGAHTTNVVIGNVLRATTNGSITSGAFIVTSTGFVAADIGRTIIVHGAGVSGRSLVAVINSRTTTQATISVAAGTTVSNATVLVMGGSTALTNDESDDDESQMFRRWLKRQLANGKTRAQSVGHIVIKDVP